MWAQMAWEVRNLWGEESWSSLDPSNLQDSAFKTKISHDCFKGFCKRSLTDCRFVSHVFSWALFRLNRFHWKKNRTWIYSIGCMWLVYIYIPWNIRSKCRYTVYIYPYPWSYGYNYIDMYLNVCKKDCAWLLWVCLVFMPAMMHKVGLPTWMSQEVTKSLASGLYLQYTPFISRWNNPYLPIIDPNFQRGILARDISSLSRVRFGVPSFMANQPTTPPKGNPSLISP